MRPTVLCILIAIVICAPSPHLLARDSTTAPASQATSSPASALLATAECRAAFDMSGLKEVTIGDEAASTYYEAVMKADRAEEELHAGAVERFGQAAKQETSYAQQELHSLQAFIERAVVSINGDIATLSDPQSDSKYTAKRINGQWKIQLPERSPTEFDEAMKAVGAYTAVMMALGDQVKAGAFSTYQELDATRSQKLNALSRVRSTSRPTTMTAGVSPTDVVGMFWERVAAKDLAGAKELVVANDDAYQYLEAWIASGRASDDLEAAARERFGESAKRMFPEGKRSLGIIVAALQVEELNGHEGVVLDVAYGMRFPVKQIDGKWKVDWSQQSAERGALELKQTVMETQMVKDLTAKVKAGQFHSVDELDKAREYGMMKVIDSLGPSSATSKPAQH